MTAFYNRGLRDALAGEPCNPRSAIEDYCWINDRERFLSGKGPRMIGNSSIRDYKHGYRVGERLRQ